VTETKARTTQLMINKDSVSAFLKKTKDVMNADKNAAIEARPKNRNLCRKEMLVDISLLTRDHQKSIENNIDKNIPAECAMRVAMNLEGINE
jgi:hypothetical protein